MHDEEDLYARVKDFLTRQLSLLSSYHDHKENMAHAGLLVLLALMAAVVGTETWPPKWLAKLLSCNKIVAMVGVIIIWLLTHIYIRWQLRHRRVAALLVKHLKITLKNLTYSPPTEQGLEVYTDHVEEQCRIQKFLDSLLPCAGKLPPTDEKLTSYPRAMVENMLNDTATEATRAEWLLFGGSLVILIVMLVRTFPH